MLSCQLARKERLNKPKTLIKKEDKTTRYREKRTSENQIASIVYVH